MGRVLWEYLYCVIRWDLNFLRLFFVVAIFARRMKGIGMNTLDLYATFIAHLFKFLNFCYYLHIHLFKMEGLNRKNSSDDSNIMYRKFIERLKETRFDINAGPRRIVAENKSAFDPKNNIFKMESTRKDFESLGAILNRESNRRQIFNLSSVM